MEERVLGQVKACWALASLLHGIAEDEQKKYSLPLALTPGACCEVVNGHFKHCLSGFEYPSVYSKATCHLFYSLVLSAHVTISCYVPLALFATPANGLGPPRGQGNGRESPCSRLGARLLVP